MDGRSAAYILKTTIAPPNGDGLIYEIEYTKKGCLQATLYRQQLADTF